MAVLLIGLAVGYWAVFYHSATGYAITGSSGEHQLVITTDFANKTFDLETQTEVLQGLLITNNGDPIDLLLTKEISFIPEDEACSDQDIIFTFQDYAGNYTSGEMVHVNGQSHAFELLAEAPYGTLSCGGDYIVKITLEE